VIFIFKDYNHTKQKNLFISTPYRSRKKFQINSSNGINFTSKNHPIGEKQKAEKKSNVKKEKP
jgi:hypothetical protein